MPYKRNAMTLEAFESSRCRSRGRCNPSHDMPVLRVFCKTRVRSWGRLKISSGNFTKQSTRRRESKGARKGEEEGWTSHNVRIKERSAVVPRIRMISPESVTRAAYGFERWTLRASSPEGVMILSKIRNSALQSPGGGLVARAITLSKRKARNFDTTLVATRVRSRPRKRDRAVIGACEGHFHPVWRCLTGYVGPKVRAVCCDCAPTLTDLCDANPCAFGR